MLGACLAGNRDDPTYSEWISACEIPDTEDCGKWMLDLMLKSPKKSRVQAVIDNIPEEQPKQRPKLHKYRPISPLASPRVLSSAFSEQSEEEPCASGLSPD